MGLNMYLCVFVCVLLSIINWAFLHLAVCTRWPDNISVPGGLVASQLDVIPLFHWKLLNYHAHFSPASCRRVAFASASCTSVYVPPDQYVTSASTYSQRKATNGMPGSFICRISPPPPRTSPRASVFLPMFAHIRLAWIFVDKKTLWSVLKSSVWYSIMLVLLGARQKFATPLGAFHYSATELNIEDLRFWWLLRGFSIMPGGRKDARARFWSSKGGPGGKKGGNWVGSGRNLSKNRFSFLCNRIS